MFFLLSLGLRFWNLEQFNTLVFDEIYYAKFANNYLTQTPFFNSHPPLTEYLIAIGMWIGSWFPASPQITNDLTGSWHSTISYRWLNALTGSFFPIILGAIAYQLSHRHSYTIIVTLLATLEGLFLVESRYALNNIYLVTFGLLGCLFFLLYINKKNSLFLTLSGIFLGTSVAIKWNGLGFLLGIYLIIFIVYLSQKLEHLFDSRNLGIFENIKLVKSFLLVFNLLIIPICTYSILWVPYLLFNPNYSLWEIHQKIWFFHQSIGDGSEVHPYCSKWYSWLVMARPIAYYYDKKSTSSGTIIHNVHAMGNPILWWLATGSILIFSIFIILILYKRKYNPFFSILFFVLINYFVNLLPWILVSRCTFLYHYMSAYSFSLLGIGLMIEQCLISQFVLNRQLGIILLLSISLAFIYWLPIYIGLPLSPREFYLRMLPNWI